MGSGGACTYCELKCPIVDQVAVIPKRLEASQVANFAAYVLAGDQMMKVAKKTLKAYCVANGPVVVGNVVFENRPVLERKYPISEVLAVLQKRNIMGAFDQSASDGLTISHSALSKLMKAYPALAEDFAPFVQEKTTYRFGSRKPGGDDDEEA